MELMKIPAARGVGVCWKPALPRETVCRAAEMETMQRGHVQQLFFTLLANYQPNKEQPAVHVHDTPLD